MVIRSTVPQLACRFAGAPSAQRPDAPTGSPVTRHLLKPASSNAGSREIILFLAQPAVGAAMEDCSGALASKFLHRQGQTLRRAGRWDLGQPGPSKSPSTCTRNTLRPVAD